MLERINPQNASELVVEYMQYLLKQGYREATMEYHRTKDILHVMRVLGHKNIKNTMVYTHLLPESKEEYVCKVAKDVAEAKALIEDGFEYVTDMDGFKLFRKRK